MHLHGGYIVGSFFLLGYNMFFWYYYYSIYSLLFFNFSSVTITIIIILYYLLYNDNLFTICYSMHSFYILNNIYPPNCSAKLNYPPSWVVQPSWTTLINLQCRLLARICFCHLLFFTVILYNHFIFEIFIVFLLRGDQTFLIH